MSGWTATECARGLPAIAGFKSEEDGVGGRKAREEVLSLPVPRAPSAGPARDEEGGRADVIRTGAERRRGSSSRTASGRRQSGPMGSRTSG